MTISSERPADTAGTTARGMREIAHGELLAHSNTDAVWGWDTPAGRLRFARRAQLVTEAARMKPGDRVLELGCGTGLFTEAFAHSGADITAVDISPPLLERARTRNRDAANVTFVLGQFESAEFGPPFDAIVGSSILHHLDVARALGRSHELLKAGGRMAFAEPNMLNPQVFAERAFRFLPPFNRYMSPDETAFIRFRLRGLIERAGFIDVRIVPFDFLHPATPPSLIPAVGALGRVAERLWGVREISGSLLISCRKPAA